MKNCIIILENEENKTETKASLTRTKDLLIAKTKDFEIIYDEKMKRITKKENKKNLIRIDIENEKINIKETNYELDIDIKITKYKNDKNNLTLEYKIDNNIFKISIKEGNYE